MYHTHRSCMSACNQHICSRALLWLPFVYVSHNTWTWRKACAHSPVMVGKDKEQERGIQQQECNEGGGKTRGGGLKEEIKGRGVEGGGLVCYLLFCKCITTLTITHTQKEKLVGWDCRLVFNERQFYKFLIGCFSVPQGRAEGKL